MQPHLSDPTPVYHARSPRVTPLAAHARAVLVEHVLDPFSGCCRSCGEFGPCPPADRAFAQLTAMGAHVAEPPRPTVREAVTAAFRTVATYLRPNGTTPAEPPPGCVDLLLWRLASRLDADHQPNHDGRCTCCLQPFPCLGRRLADRGLTRVTAVQRRLPQPEPHRAHPADPRPLAQPRTTGERPGWAWRLAA